MTARLVGLAAMFWLFVCVPFFALGHEFLDPSQEYSAERQAWVAIVQWAALLVPPLALWVGTRIFSSESQ